MARNERTYRDAKTYTIVEGSSEIQRPAISRALTGRHIRSGAALRTRVGLVTCLIGDPVPIRMGRAWYGTLFRLLG